MNRIIILLLSFTVSGMCEIVSNSSSIFPYHLTVEYLENPLAVELSSPPRLGWRLGGRLVHHKLPNNLSQTAYQILAASNASLLLREADLWDSGKVDSNIHVNINYEGKIPAPGERVYWTVRIWDQYDNASKYANVSFWDNGYNVTQWAAQWIGAPTYIQKRGLNNISAEDNAVISAHPGLKPVVYLRKTFSLDSDVKEAKVYATAKGLYRLFVNSESGVTVGTDIPLLTPGWTDYSKSFQYQVYNVTKFIGTKNTIGVLLGTGWFTGYVGFMNGYGYYGKNEAFLMELHLEFKNGSREIIRSDYTWKATTGPLIYSDLFHGEVHYENRILHDWLKFEYDDSKWTNVNAVIIDKTVLLVAEQSPSIVELEPINAEYAWESSPGVWVYDFHSNFAGYVSLQLNNFTSVSRIQVRHAEMLHPNGTVYTSNLGSARATDTYLLNDPEKRKQTLVLKPHFTYHGFRYVEVSGIPRKLDFLSEIQGIRIGIPGINNGIETDNFMVTTLMKNIRNSQVANFISVPTDCPQRSERLGWMGDAQVFTHTALYNGDVASFYTKWLRDIREAQLPEGGFSFISPRIIISASGCPAWGDAGVIVAWHVYRMYGDLQIVRDHFEAMEKWIEYILSENPTLIWVNRTNGDLGDWLNVNEETPKAVISTAYFAYDTLLLSYMSRAIGKISNADKYSKLHSEIAKAFVKEFVNSTDGKIRGDTQTGYSLALAFRLLPDELIPKAVDNLIANIQRHNWHLTTGFLGVGYLLPVLTENGRPDVAYKLLLQNTFPSWGFMIENNATSMWERWDGWSKEKGFKTNDMNSFNHSPLGSVGRWLYQYMAGIDTDNEEVGFKKIHIKPHIGTGINFTAAWYYSVRGLIKVQWKIVKNNFDLLVTIPINSKAIITLPFLKENWTREIQSGEYHFNVPLQ